jgi:hypothetical protein
MSGRTPSPGPRDDRVGNGPVERAFRAMDEAGIRWCLLRGEDDPSGGRDVDVLVARSDRRELDTALAKAEFTLVPAWGLGSHRFFLSRDPSLERWIKFDVVTELSFGEGFALRSGAEASCLARRARSSGLWTLDPDDAFWALLMHRLLDKGSIDRTSNERLRELALAAGVDGSLAKAVARACPEDWSPQRIIDVARHSDARSLEPLAPTLVRAWTRLDPAGNWLRRVRHRQARAVGRVATAWRRPGVGVAILAPDGAGKSTLAEGLFSAFPLPARTIYMSPRRATDDARGIGGLARRLLRLWGGWLWGRYHVARGRLVVFDRYPLEALVAPRQRKGARVKLRRWLIGHSCPRPELVLVLDADGATLHHRSGEIDPVTLESERLEYRRLGQRVGGYLIDATRPAGEVRDVAVDLVWRAWTARWRVT